VCIEMKTRVAAINKEIGKWQTKKQNKADGAGKQPASSDQVNSGKLFTFT